MIKKFLIYFWQSRFKFIKYFSVGITAFVLDIISLYVLKEFFGLNPVRAVILNQIFIIAFVFLMNKFFSFRADGNTRRQMIKFAAVITFNYLLSIFWMWLFNHKFGFNYLLVRTANIALAVAWNFFLYQEWVYCQEKPNPQIEL
jgi:putative flippase GtrA